MFLCFNLLMRRCTHLSQDSVGNYTLQQHSVKGARDVQEPCPPESVDKFRHCAALHSGFSELVDGLRAPLPDSLAYLFLLAYGSIMLSRKLD